MAAVTQSLRGLTAGKLMSDDVVTIPEALPIREAARRLAEARVTGAPVVDETGRCVGVFSVADIARWATRKPAPSAAPESRTCSFWEHGRDANGKQVAVCKLSAGACSLQRRQVGPKGEPLTACAQPHGVCVGEWQVLEPAECDPTVREYMTPDPVTAPTETPLRKLTQMMIDASVRRVIVVDAAGRPVGIVSSKDVIAAVARCSSDTEEGEDAVFGDPAMSAGG